MTSHNVEEQKWERTFRKRRMPLPADHLLYTHLIRGQMKHGFITPWEKIFMSACQLHYEWPFSPVLFNGLSHSYCPVKQSWPKRTELMVQGGCGSWGRGAMESAHLLYPPRDSNCRAHSMQSSAFFPWVIKEIPNLMQPSYKSSLYPSFARCRRMLCFKQSTKSALCQRHITYMESR